MSSAVDLYARGSAPRFRCGRNGVGCGCGATAYRHGAQQLLEGPHHARDDLRHHRLAVAEGLDGQQPPQPPPAASPHQPPARLSGRGPRQARGPADTARPSLAAALGLLSRWRLSKPLLQRSGERRHRTGCERMGSPTLQTVQYPSLPGLFSPEDGLREGFSATSSVGLTHRWSASCSALSCGAPSSLAWSSALPPAALALRRLLNHEPTSVLSPLSTAFAPAVARTERAATRRAPPPLVGVQRRVGGREPRGGAVEVDAVAVEVTRLMCAVTNRGCIAAVRRQASGDCTQKLPVPERRVSEGFPTR
jgi:hypothetical protein